MDRDQCHRRHLRAERFGSGDADLRPGVDEHRVVGLARNRVPERVRDRERPRADPVG